MLENQRATALARACGHADLKVLGDAFLSRYYDNESSGAPEIDEWMRESLSVSEALPSADWVQSCAVMNAGRNMNAYTR
jgi:hypothetical protein